MRDMMGTEPAPPASIVGFPFWELTFDESGSPADPSASQRLIDDAARLGATDLFVFSHGWNNDRQMALALYERFFGAVAALLEAPETRRRPASVIGIVGVVWPARRWDDEPAPIASPLPRVTRPPTDAELVRALGPVFPAHQRTLDELADLLARRPNDRAELRRFKRLMHELAADPDVEPAPEDSGERRALLASPRGANDLAIFERFAKTVPPKPHLARTTANALDPLWDGAREALRALTYWEMKKRAGVVGQVGLGPLLGQLGAANPSLRMHLLGHSFGARLVSYALSGLPRDQVGSQSPIKSLVLLQGAFSHFAFADALPFDPSRAGALAGALARVDGPIAVSFSRFDTAVGDLYPLASIPVGDDASAPRGLFFRWGAMGHDGAQAVRAVTLPLGPAGQASYPFAASKVVNLDGNDVITVGGPPAGAHGDIFHPEIAWAALAAAGIVTQPNQAASDGG
jgi:hypothetical protein